jgi:hypothetical protein
MLNHKRGQGYKAITDDADVTVSKTLQYVSRDIAVGRVQRSTLVHG